MEKNMTLLLCYMKILAIDVNSFFKIFRTINHLAIHINRTLSTFKNIKGISNFSLDYYISIFRKCNTLHTSNQCFNLVAIRGIKNITGLQSLSQIVIRAGWLRENLMQKDYPRKSKSLFSNPLSIDFWGSIPFDEKCY